MAEIGGPGGNEVLVEVAVGPGVVEVEVGVGFEAWLVQPARTGASKTRMSAKGSFMPSPELSGRPDNFAVAGGRVPTVQHGNSTQTKFHVHPLVRIDKEVLAVNLDAGAWPRENAR
jgi:hypothetical protein